MAAQLPSPHFTRTEFLPPVLRGRHVPDANTQKSLLSARRVTARSLSRLLHATYAPKGRTCTTLPSSPVTSPAALSCRSTPAPPACPPSPSSSSLPQGWEPIRLFPPFRLRSHATSPEKLPRLGKVPHPSGLYCLTSSPQTVLLVTKRGPQ